MTPITNPSYAFGRITSLDAAARQASDPMMIMRRIVDESLMLIPTADGAVVEIAHEEQLTYVCASGSLAGHVGQRLRIDESLSGLAVRTGETLCCEDCETDPRVDREACRRVGAISMLCVPLQRGSDRVGALKMTAARRRAFSTQDVAVLARLADFISATIAAVTDVARTADELLAACSRPQEEISAADERPGSRDDQDRLMASSINEFMVNVLRPGAVANLAIKERIERVLDEGTITVLAQPIVDLDCGEILGAEALARFPHPPAQPPDAWFADADRVGLGVPLQLTAVRLALELLDHLPHDSFLAINVGPDALVSPQLPELLAAAPGERIVLELTEHLRVDDYPHLRDVLRDVRTTGIRLAIDDTGAGFASLSHIVNLAPDLIKLDRQFTTGIDLDPVRRALAQALVSFASDTGAEVIAEGIETVDELDVVRRLGIPYGQGYFLGRPGPASAVTGCSPTWLQQAPTAAARSAVGQTLDLS